jgi:hypothetical protein
MNVSRTFTAKTDAKGIFNTAFTPDAVGKWIVYLSWPGDDEYSASKTSISINVGRGILSVDLKVNPTNPKINSNVTVSGWFSTPIDTVVSMTIISPTGSSSRFNVQVSKGSFTYMFKVGETGTWIVDVSWPGNEVFQEFSKVQTFEVSPPEAGFLFGLSITQLLIIASAVITAVAIILIIKRR